MPTKNKITRKNTGNKYVDPALITESGHNYAARNQYAAAERCFRKAIELDSCSAVAYNNLGRIRQLRGDVKQAMQYYKLALKCDRRYAPASKNIAAIYHEKGRYNEAKKILLGLLARNRNDYDVLECLTNYAMTLGKLRDASRFAEKLSAVRCGYNPGKPFDAETRSIMNVPARLSVQKLQHDIEQFRHLKKQGVKIKNLDRIIKNYTLVLDQILPLGNAARPVLTASQQNLIGHEFNRIIYRPATPRVKRALSDKWHIATAGNDGISAENAYKESILGLTVIDNFLTEKALAGLRKFCNESTVWFENRYTHGRLGAFFRQGFNCPLLVQIAEEIKAAFPSVIGREHTLLQLWGFKCDHFQPPIAPHADFAAVNVNFWITPDDANLDQDSGGMIIYDVEAPLEWDFDSYNNQGDKIIKFLKRKKARAVTIPYKANRAIIFNSDLFHVTAPVQFKNDYPSRRINITMLYGKRENSTMHHDEM